MTGFKELIAKRKTRLNESYLDELVRLRLLSISQLTSILESGKPLEKLQAAKIVLAAIEGARPH